MKIPMENIKKQYIVFVNQKVFVKTAYDLGYEYVVCCENGIISSDFIRLLKKNDKAALLIYYCVEDIFPFDIKSDYSKIDMIPLYGMKVKDGKEKVVIKTLDDAIRLFPSVEYSEKQLMKNEKILSTNYTDRCGQCHKKMRKKDEFCRYCGTKRGEGPFEPFNPYYNEISVVYGPPIRGINNIVHKCTKCSYIWTIKKRGWTNVWYCPKCGSEVDISYEPVEE